MFKSHLNKLSALLLAPAFLFISAAVAAQDAPSPQATGRADTSDAPVATRPKEDESEGAPKDEASSASVASNVAQPSGSRFGFETNASRVTGIGSVASERALFAPEKFEQQDDRTKPAPPPTRTPLTGEQKMKYAAKRAFLSPDGYATTAFSAAITEYTEDDLPHKTNEDRFADFASRFAIRFTTRATNRLLGQGVFPILFKQDPRYRPADKGKNVFKRAAHAASRVFVTDDDDGHLEPNYSRWAGALSSSAIANLYEQSTPGRDRIGADATFRRFGSSFTSGMVNNVIREFLPDIIGIFKK